jgi:hypothetical protein
MTMRRWTAVTTVGLVSAATIFIASPAAGAHPAPAARTSVSAIVAPDTDLRDALAALAKEGYNVTGHRGATGAGSSGSSELTGSVDPPKRSATETVKGTAGSISVSLQATQIGADLWARIDIGQLNSRLGVQPDQWLKLDPARITDVRNRPFDFTGPGDPLDMAGLLKTVSGLRATDATHIAGTVDLTASTGVTAPDPQELARAGTAAKTTPFTATLDDQGRLTALTIDANAFNPDMNLQVTFSDFGSPSPITAPPAADVVPAPEAVYQLFNG